VVERPASAVKELVENAIDAGASRIDIFTDGGGRRRIGITDDGSGMTFCDLALAVDRHATSKLDDEDLLRIRTLGFRGEALPSIGAVRLGITTAVPEPHAWSLSVEGGAKSASCRRRVGHPGRGQRSLLCNLTRLKFLKTDAPRPKRSVRWCAARDGAADIAFRWPGEARPSPGRRLGRCRPATRLGDILGADFRSCAIEVRAERGRCGRLRRRR
jgi:DNA mismatch repair protein MutL